MLTCGVIIPFADRVEFLHDAITSVYRQTVVPNEVLVVGNVPLPENCRKFYINDSFYFMQTELEGFPAKVNYMAKLLTTDALFVLCDDDKIRPDFVERTVHMMEITDADIVYTDMEMFGLDPRIVPAADWSGYNFYLSTVPFITSLTSMELFKEVGGYENVPFCDWDLWWRCYDLGVVAYHIKEPLFLYRTSEQQGSRLPEQIYAVEQNQATVRSRHVDRVSM